MTDGPGGGVRVREAREDDLAAIVALLADDGIGRGREAPGDPAYRRAFEAMTSQPGNVYLVVEWDGVIHGCLQYTCIHGLSRRGATRVQVEGVRVAAAARGQGIGQAMFDRVFARAGRDGATLVQLTTDRARGDARRFYERLGFVASHHGMKLLV